MGVASSNEPGGYAPGQGDAMTTAVEIADRATPADPPPAAIRVFRIDDWLHPEEVPGELARTVGAGRAREVVALGRWSAARREWAAQVRVPRAHPSRR